VRSCEFYLTGPKHSPLSGLRKRGDEPSDSMKEREILAFLNEYQLLIERSLIELIICKERTDLPHKGYKIF
jgi:hypothetical protein